ncbi:TPM domain-containing protein [Chitiniphilus shinanonensis]|uniref:TPM domain-containing protein n=1 Tax=Chitiniphilus shinanonensis TaxID=553088 RepID=UPI003022DE84
MKHLCCLALLWLCALLPVAHAEVAVPPPGQRVLDLTHTLTPAQRDALVERLRRLEHNTGSQLAVLLVSTTQPETIEQYGIRVAEAWKLGRKGVDDGVLLLVAKDDRKVRIEVGYGLEGALTDAATGRIVRDQIVPAFRSNDYAGGIAAGVAQLAHLIDGEPLPAPAEPEVPPVGLLILSGLGIMVVLFIVVFVWLSRRPGGLGREPVGEAQAARDDDTSSRRDERDEDKDDFSGSGGRFGGGGASGSW